MPDSNVAQPDSDATAGDAGPPACVVPEGTPNNEKGIGGYCTTFADCKTDAGDRLCTADFGIEPTFCTTLCVEDVECGTGMYCAHSAQGDGCTPLSCRAGSD